MFNWEPLPCTSSPSLFDQNCEKKRLMRTLDWHILLKDQQINQNMISFHLTQLLQNITTRKLFSIHVVSMSSSKILDLNNLSTVEGAFKKRRRWGRGIGSGRGKTCGWGHQKSRSTPRGFEGGKCQNFFTGIF